MENASPKVKNLLLENHLGVVGTAYVKVHGAVRERVILRKVRGSSFVGYVAPQVIVPEVEEIVLPDGGSVYLDGNWDTGWDELISAQLDYRTRPCNLVELMPRLKTGGTSH